MSCALAWLWTSLLVIGTFGQLYKLPEHLEEFEVSPWLLDYLLNSTQYDLRVRPASSSPDQPLQVRTSIYLYFLGHIDTQGLSFDTHFLIRHRWQDPRLRYSHLTSHNQLSLEGENWFSDRIWTPNIYIPNEISSEVMSLKRDSVFTRISSNGQVNFSYRVRASLLCNIQLSRFPHDSQKCKLPLESWSFTESDLLLAWESPLSAAFDMSHFKMIEYYFDSEADVELAVESTPYKMHTPSPRLGAGLGRKVAGNFSTLSVTVTLNRYVSQYVLDYYIPSSLLVAMSWVSFWLEPGAIPGRTTLGTASWLTFITLNRAVTTEVSRVAYIKFADVWFLVCTVFIFASLLEFALVNVIHRSPKWVSLPGRGGAAIVREGLREVSRSAFTTPSLRRKDAGLSSKKEEDSLKEEHEEEQGREPGLWLQVEQLSSPSTPPPAPREVGQGSRETGGLNIVDRLRMRRRERSQEVRLTVEQEQEQEQEQGEKEQELHISHQEIAVWIDCQARWLFPLTFLAWVVFYFLAIEHRLMDKLLFLPDQLH